MCRIVVGGGRAVEEDWGLAAETLHLLDVQIQPQPPNTSESSGEVAASSYDTFLRDAFIQHENIKSEDEERRFVRAGRSSRVAVASSLVVHRPDLVLVGEDGSKVLGHRSLLSLFSPVFRQLLPHHDQQEALLALSLPLQEDALSAFHR